ncbi:MAG: tRNA epoxyqueuosine(34) reductase QueG [Gemmataceae bacterium]|nr:tRNA epoxyqueuosine(34) reductase QueG [Gemmataceae bacterium]
MLDRENRLKKHILDLGFAVVGIARAEPADRFDEFEQWLAAGRHGTMQFLADHAIQRRHPEGILPGVRSVVVVGLADSVPRADESRETWPPADGPNSGRVARFAWGRDYHQAIWRRLDSVETWLDAEVPGCRVRTVADTAPLLERGFARRAGLGWIGKNTMLINKHWGSYLMLGAVLTDVDLRPDLSHDTSHCGTCTACLTACPTQAFSAPGELDARKCISYINIEVKGRFSEFERTAVDDWMFGCDICQDVCPWNRKEVSPTPRTDAVALLTQTLGEFRDRFTGTPASRTYRKGLARNAAAVLGNFGTPDALPALRKAVADTDPAVREIAEWAIRQIESRHSGISSTGLSSRAD